MINESESGGGRLAIPSTSLNPDLLRDREVGTHSALLDLYPKLCIQYPYVLIYLSVHTNSI